MGLGPQWVDAGDVVNFVPRAPVLAVEFGMQPVPDERASAEAGRPVFKDEEYIKIFIPGDRLGGPLHKRVTEKIRQQYAAQYKAWKTGGDQLAASGTPLKVWAAPGLTAAVVETLRHSRCFTVEQLAGMTDQALSGLGPGYLPLRNFAKEWLKSAQSTAPLAKLHSENEALRAELEGLKMMVSKISEAQQAKEPPKTRKAQEQPA